ncbi:MAG: AsmA family protein, partial [Burkholderiales bacterium]
MNSLLLTLTAVLILVLSALFAAPLFIDWNDYRSVFETQATNLLGRQVKVGGKVHLVLLPAPELKFDDIKVADQEGRLDRPFLEARSLEAWLNIGALLSGTIEARKIAMVDPILRLDLKADGTGNWSDVGRRGVALPFAPKDVLLDEVGVSGGRIEITKQGLPQFTLTEVVGDMSAQSLSGPYKVSASYLFGGRPQELRFSTSEPDAAGVFRIKSALRDLDRNTTFSVDGGVTGLGAKPQFDGAIVV